MRWIRAVGLLLMLLPQWGRAQDVIRLKTRTLRPRGAGLLHERKLEDGRHFLIQFSSYPDRQMRQSLVGRGIRILEYVPDNALMVAAGRGADLTGLEVKWTGSLDAIDKLSPQIAVIASPAFIAIFHGDVELSVARSIVQNLGLGLLPNPHLLSNHLLISGSYAQLLQLAASDAVAYILPASADLVSNAPVMGCIGGSTEAGAVAEYAQASTGWSKDSTGVVSLQYFFQSVAGKLDKATVEGEVERAFREWERYAPIRLTEAQQADAVRTIAIRFASGAHGDDYPFDGPGGILAHTYYPAPPNPEPVAGDMHLDADESWDNGVDLYSVILHETGHALGLGHSDVPGAVMYPYYRVAAGLTDDDIAGIQSLYGKAEASASDPATPGAPPSRADPSGPTLPPPNPTSPTQPAEPTLPPPTIPPASPGDPVPPSEPGTPAAPSDPTPVIPDDRTPPSLAITSPGTTILSTFAAVLAINGTASDNVAVSEVRWSTSNGDTGMASGTSNWKASVPLLVGTTVVMVRAFDAAGNSSWRSVSVVRH